MFDHMSSTAKKASTVEQYRERVQAVLLHIQRDLDGEHTLEELGKRINNPSISGDLQACAVEILRKQGVQFGF